MIGRANGAKATLAAGGALLAMALGAAAGIAATPAPFTLHERALADSDGYVPEYRTCRLPDGVVGRYLYRVNRNGTVEGIVKFDPCEMRRIGAGPELRASIRAHERAHSRGFNHCEGSPATNPAYWPSIYRRGC